jgi:hypothetical protein
MSKVGMIDVDGLPALEGQFRPSTLGRLREIAAQRSALQAQDTALEGEAARLVAAVIEMAGHDLPVGAEWDVSGDTNRWRVTPPEPAP